MNLSSLRLGQLETNTEMAVACRMGCKRVAAHGRRDTRPSWLCTCCLLALTPPQPSLARFSRPSVNWKHAQLTTMPLGDFENLDNHQRAALDSKLHHALTCDTPTRPVRCAQRPGRAWDLGDGAPAAADDSRPAAPAPACRPQVEAVCLARDAVNHHALRRAWPFLLEDRTNLLGASSVALTDGQGRFAVLACAFIPPATAGAALQSRLEGARALAEQRAEEVRRRVAVAAPASDSGAVAEPQVAVGMVSNTGGLEWVVPPVGMPHLCKPPAAAARRTKSASTAAAGCGVGRLWRWAVAAAAAVIAALLAAAGGRG